MHHVFVPYSTATRCVVAGKYYRPGFYSCKCAMEFPDESRKLDIDSIIDLSGGKKILLAWIERWVTAVRELGRAAKLRRA